jgi:hypothetical protein
MSNIKRVLLTAFFSLVVLGLTSCDGSYSLVGSSTPGNSSVIRDAIQTGKNTATVFFEGSQKIADVSNSDFIVKGESTTYTITQGLIEEFEIEFSRKSTNKITVSPDFINGDTITISGAGKMHGWAEFTVTE